MALITPPLALYLHFPWCVRKCPYCDFNSHALNDELPQQAYLEALLEDLEAQLPQVAGRRIVSVFLGGGTPSLFEPTALAKLFESLRSRLPLTAAAKSRSRRIRWHHRAGPLRRLPGRRRQPRVTRRAELLAPARGSRTHPQRKTPTPLLN
jgi:hypothetical protein